MLEEYNQKRDFNKTAEPQGSKRSSSGKKLHFVIQHHMARREHYDLRLEWNGALISWAVPKGPSFNPNEKRLAIRVEDHPLEYASFEGSIPQGQYGGGTVMLWDEGFWESSKFIDDDVIKFALYGKRLVGKWTLVRTKKAEGQWLLIKENDEFAKTTNGITDYITSIKTKRTMKEIELGVKISSPDKVVFSDLKITKMDIAMYYQKVAARMLPYIKNRKLSLVVCPQNVSDCFYKKNSGNGIPLEPISDINELLRHVQNNTLEFHIWGSVGEDNPDIMVFDLDPDEGMNLKQIQQGVKDLKSILDELKLVSFIKTSGGKGYHIVVPLKATVNWEKFSAFSKSIAEVMEKKWPKLYTTNIRKTSRKGKIFIDWIRNTRGHTSIAPYAVRAKKDARVSMPIGWDEIEKIAPNAISMEEAVKRLEGPDPWKDFIKTQSTQWIQ